MMRGMNRSSATLLKTAVDAGITSPAELANLMAQGSVESEGYRKMYEDLNYTTADQLIGAVASSVERFGRRGVEAAVESGDPEQVAKVLYEGRTDLGNNEPDDGYKYRGRGLFQITGRDNYARFGRKFGIDLIEEPDLAAAPEAAAKIAVAFWKTRVGQRHRLDPILAGNDINGGENGREMRISENRRWSAFITDDLVHEIQRGVLDVDSLTAMGDVRGDAERDAREAAMRVLQRGLNQLGYRDGHGRRLAEDGGYGRRTREAVVAFQRDNGLTPDGIAGERTLALLEDAVRARGHVAEQRPMAPRFPADAPVRPETQDTPRLAPALGSMATEQLAQRPALEAAGPTRTQSEFRSTPDVDILRMQQQLNALGMRDMSDNRLAEDGMYGNLTHTAVARFQAHQGLPITGVPDDATRGSIESKAFLADLQQFQQRPRQWEMPTAPQVADEGPTIQWRDQQGPTIQWRQPAIDPLESERAPELDRSASVRRPGDDMPSAPSLAPEAKPSLSDPRNPESPKHELYSELGRRVPEASEDRLLQFTAACHTHRITADNLSTCHLNEQNMTMGFLGSGPLAMPVTVDLTKPPPVPEQAVEQIAQYDQQQALVRSEYLAQQQQMSRSGPSL